eukprot:6214614-Pleurochrysis_carterae.AAC.5
MPNLAPRLPLSFDPSFPPSFPPFFPPSFAPSLPLARDPLARVFLPPPRRVASICVKFAVAASNVADFGRNGATTLAANSDFAIFAQTVPAPRRSALLGTASALAVDAAHAVAVAVAAPRVALPHATRSFSLLLATTAPSRLASPSAAALIGFVANIATGSTLSGNATSSRVPAAAPSNSSTIEYIPAPRGLASASATASAYLSGVRITARTSSVAACTRFKNRSNVSKVKPPLRRSLPPSCHLNQLVCVQNLRSVEAPRAVAGFAQAAWLPR